MARWVAARALRVEPAVAPGRLVALHDGGGWYPALVPGNGQVRGVVATLRLRPGERALLDRYEGREYRRRALVVRTPDDRRVVQAYVWRGRLPERAMAIGPDFLDWLREGGRRPCPSPLAFRTVCP